MRIVARKLTDGRIEFGLQQRRTNESWSDRMLPSRRFFPANAQVGRWLVSSLVSTTPPPATARVDDDTQTTQITSTHVASTNPDACRPPGTGTVGFPLPEWALRSVGTVRIAVLFLDFPDAIAAHTTAIEAESNLAYTEKYLEAMSYGKLDIEYTILPQWLRAEQSYEDHLEESRLEGFATLGDVQNVAVPLADPEFDFTGHDVVMIVMPSSHFIGGTALGAVDTQEGVVPATVRINIFREDSSKGGPRRWPLTSSHELLHVFGLVDYYSYDLSRRLPEPPAGKIWAYGSFGRMGLWAAFLADERDHRLAHVFHFSNGSRSTRYDDVIWSEEMLAWSRWQLGWLDDRQIRCVTEANATVSLNPVAAPGNGIAMVAIPLSETEVIAIESRRKIAYDKGREVRWPSGNHTTYPGLPIEGLLVYTVDTALEPGELPLKVAGDTGDGQIDAYPILAEGQSVSIRGITITLQSTTATSHTVKITRSAE
ncbi:MAG: hypothetical protein F4121_13500 [Acidimicrobiia bacterium]|nr:hypothetical protein [Acidimicrobiia bacterium]MYI21042.1 hypothetical protein [Acidimicrobiia bacterium]